MGFRRCAVDKMVDRSFWSGRRVLVTGHTGFKGSWLCSWLLQMGAEVFGYALAPEGDPTLFEVLGLEHQLDHELNDIRDQTALDRRFAACQPELVFHLAAQPLVRRSYREPDLTFETNIMGSLRVMEAARRCESTRGIVYVTSDKCYANQEWSHGYRENDRMGGHDPYSASKGAAELLLDAYRSSFFVPKGRIRAASVRAGNVIGGGDWAEDRIVPDCIRALSTGQSIEVRNPIARRPWQHVLEPLGGYLHIAERLLGEDGAAYAEGWNFGPELGSNRPVGELVDAMIAAWGSGSRTSPPQTGAVHEATLLHLNCDKAGHRLGWFPALDFNTTIEWTARWFQTWAHGGDLKSLTAEQIQTYQALYQRKA